MTQTEILTLLEKRNDAWERLGHYHEPLGTMKADRRREVEQLTADYWAANRQIVEHLVAKKKPVVVGDKVLHLTTDRASFIVLEKQTREPAYIGPHYRKTAGWKCLLYTYPTNGAPH